ncbi:MAG: polyribonucleotide nucleotidyltransferase [Nitrospinae bacterium]|nr:polyribonucleotide nucleotidyltransferase [Nitrospinota bacterium]
MLAKVESEIRSGNKLSIEGGEIARQTNGAVLVRYGDIVVLATAVTENKEGKDTSFFPLSVDYREKTYAAGKIPGGFFKREGRPSEKEILTSRLIDRPIRPLFPAGFTKETQIICMTLSADQENAPDILAIIGSSAALTISDIPFLGPIGAVGVGRVDGEFVVNPSYKELEDGDLNLVIAGTEESIVMVEGEAKEITEDVLVGAMMYGHENIKKIIKLQTELKGMIGKEKIKVEEPSIDSGLRNRVREMVTDGIKKAVIISNKLERKIAMDKVLNEFLEQLTEEERDKKTTEVKNLFEEIEREIVRNLIIEEGIRSDGRGLKEIRPISCNVSVLPRTHGSALFTRGETQAIVVTTLGSSVDEQTIEKLEGKTKKSFMLHYNFPPFCVGEADSLRSPGRREIGHGALAERALIPILPSKEEFPYTIRVVSDILESNGSSSMATVCGASLSLMDAGIPIKTPVAGIAMGLIKEGEKVCILSDILGLEDHLGDMDFKVAGTKRGITAFQMDIKIDGVTREIIEEALEQAREGRLYILEKMNSVISEVRPELSEYAPRIKTIKINSDKVKDVIGPGGKIIRNIIEETGVIIDIEDNGVISIVSTNKESTEKAIDIIRRLTQEAEVGEIYMGKVKKIMDFGAFVEIFPGTDGLVHISQISDRRVNKVSDELKEGDEIMVKVLEVTSEGKIRLSHKEAKNERKDVERK